MTKFKTLDDWEREQIDTYIRNGGHVLRMTTQQFYDALEEKAEAGRKRASARSKAMHIKRQMKLGTGYKQRQDELNDGVSK